MAAFCIAGRADEVSHGGHVEFLCGVRSSPIRQTLRTHQGTEDQDGFYPSKPRLPACLGCLRWIKGGKLYLPLILRTNLSLQFRQPCKKKRKL